MTRALQLAAKGRGNTSPNPMVGAVIVKGGKIVGEGYHKKAGTAHAEIVALRKAGERARGATLYVNLEPCCHHGKTGPCTKAIIAAGIRRLVFSLNDPDNRVSGQGAAVLRKAGVQVSAGLLKAEAEQLNEFYLFAQRRMRPYVILKLAQSLDGRIAAKSGDSKWISGTESRKFVHQMRSEVDAVLVGAETVRQDNPHLTLRLVKGRDPLRLIAVGRRPISTTSSLMAQNKDHKTIVIVEASRSNDAVAKKMERPGAEVWRVAGSDGRIRPKALLSKAHRKGIRSILIEGGSALATSFVRAKLVDKLILFTAPILIGEGRDSFGDLGLTKVSKAVQFERVARFELGRDQVFIGHPNWSR